LLKGRYAPVNYEEIDFPTPINQITKLEEQNRNLAINVLAGKTTMLKFIG